MRKSMREYNNRTESPYGKKEGAPGRRGKFTGDRGGKFAGDRGSRRGAQMPPRGGIRRSAERSGKPEETVQSTTLRIGEQQMMKVVRRVEFGLYLESIDAVREQDNTGLKKEQVLLPNSQVPEGAQIGDEIEVFLYRDSEDRVIATRKQPKLKLHEVGYLDVRETGRIGAFLDWGLDKDLLLPFREQPKVRVREGQEVLVAVYLDKSGRLCATMNVYPYLRKDSPYAKDDRVTGIVYETSRNFGAFVAVDSQFSALIPRREMTHELRVGEVVSARVVEVKPDGKLDLSLREKAYLQMDADAQKLIRMMENQGGQLDFTDKASPEIIRERTQMSKNEFKRAVGRLLKQGKIEIREESIILKNND